MSTSSHWWLQHLSVINCWQGIFLLSRCSERSRPVQLWKGSGWPSCMEHNRTERRHPLTVWVGDNLLGEEEQVVSFSFLVQMCRLQCMLVWHFFFRSCFLIPVGGKQDTPLGQLWLLQLAFCSCEILGWRKKLPPCSSGPGSARHSRAQECAVSALLPFFTFPIFTQASQALLRHFGRLPCSRCWTEGDVGGPCKDRLHSLGLSCKIRLVVVRPSWGKAQKSSQSCKNGSVTLTTWCSELLQRGFHTHNYMFT